MSYEMLESGLYFMNFLLLINVVYDPLLFLSRPHKNIYFRLLVVTEIFLLLIKTFGRSSFYLLVL